MRYCINIATMICSGTWSNTLHRPTISWMQCSNGCPNIKCHCDKRRQLAMKLSTIDAVDDVVQQDTGDQRTSTIRIACNQWAAMVARGCDKRSWQFLRVTCKFQRFSITTSHSLQPSQWHFTSVEGSDMFLDNLTSEKLLTKGLLIHFLNMNILYMLKEEMSC